MNKIVLSLADVGTIPDMEPSDLRTVQFVNITASLLALLCFLSWPIWILVKVGNLPIQFAYTIVFFISFCCCLLLNALRKYLTAKMLFAVLIMAAIAFQTFLKIGANLNHLFFYIPEITFLFFFTYKERIYAYLFLIVNSICFGLLEYRFILMTHYLTVNSQEPFLRVGFVMRIIVFLILMAFSYYLFHVVNRSENSLSQERKKSDRLLLNILPASIAARLKQADEVIADYFKDASVLFADIVDFTKLSEQLEPGEVVHLLNEVLSDFDRLAAEFGLEKIKTIGDAYMVAGGIPLPSDSHLQNLADFALQLQAHFKESSEALHNGLRIRMGMNVGPAVAGVIGKRKFIYDIWGDTINVASRMESNGVAGMIQVTEAVYGRLKQCYSLDFRDVINIKGKGNMKTYFLLAKNTPTEAV